MRRNFRTKFYLLNLFLWSAGCLSAPIHGQDSASAAKALPVSRAMVKPAPDSGASAAPVGTFNPAGNEIPVAALLDTLLKNPETRTQTIKALIPRADHNLQDFFQNLFKGNLYEYSPPAAKANPDAAQPKILVIAGPETDRDGENWVQLFKTYPMQALLDENGAPIYAKTADLTELETDREVRAMVQPLLLAFDLDNPDAKKRQSAALSLGESGDTLQLPLITAALEKEKDGKCKRLMQEASARIRLHSALPENRAAAAKALGDLHSGSALAELKILASTSGAGMESDEGARKEITRAVQTIEAYASYTSIVQNIFTGLSLGSILILMALGLAIIFGLMGVINMAHGEFMMIGAYATFIVQNLFHKYLPAPYFGYFLAVSLPIAFLTSGGIGVLVETTIIKRLYGRPLETLLATWGLSLLFVQSARSLFGDLTAVSSPELLSKGWEIFPQVVLPYNRIFIIFLTITIVSLVSLIFYRTPLGTLIRAVTQNRAMSRCLGIGTRKVDALTFGLGTGIAGIAGCALTQVGNVDPGMGQNYIVDSFMVVVTGGVGKLAGTVLSGIGIGTMNKFLEPFLQSVYAKVVLLAMVILFLQNKPSGLFPAKGRNEDL